MQRRTHLPGGRRTVGTWGEQLSVANVGNGAFHFAIRPSGYALDPAQPLSAADIVNDWDDRDLANVIYRYGEEMQSRRIARYLVQHRPFATTTQLAEAIEQATSSRRGNRLHPGDPHLSGAAHRGEPGTGATGRGAPPGAAPLETGRPPGGDQLRPGRPHRQAMAARRSTHLCAQTDPAARRLRPAAHSADSHQKAHRRR